MRKQIGIMLVLVGSILLSACGPLMGNGEIYFGSRRVDEVTQVQKMNDKPWYCAYMTCEGAQH